jgi:hypothetical protein
VSTPLLLRNVITYRVDDTEWIRLQGLKATFSENTWRSMFTWLFDQPEVRAVIQARLEGTPVLPSRRLPADQAQDRISMARRDRLQQIEGLVAELRALDVATDYIPFYQRPDTLELEDEPREESVRADLGYVGR